MRALGRVLRLGVSFRWRFALAVLCGVGALGAAVALGGTSAWLIVRAAERPPVLHLMVAIVAVRAFALGRGVLRYAELLVTHDAALRVLGRLRELVVRAAERALPARRRLFGEGDLLARFGHEVDTMVDLWVRLAVPGLVTAATAAGVVVASWLLLPAAGAVAAVAVAIMLVLPPLAVVRSPMSARRGEANADYVARTLRLLDGARELTVYGALDDELAALDDRAGHLGVIDRVVSHADGRLRALLISVAGAATIVTAMIGAPAVAAGQLSGEGLAVIVLMPLALYEALGQLASGAAAFSPLAASARRLLAVIDSASFPPPTRTSAPVPDGPLGLRLRGVGLAWPDQGPLRTGLTSPPARSPW